MTTSQKAKVAELPDTPSYSAFKLDPQEKARFRRLVQQQHSLASQIKDLEVLKARVTDDIGALLIKMDAKSVLMDAYKVTLVETVRQTLKKELLLQNGVSMETIERSSVESKSVYVKVTDTAKGK